MIQEKQQLRREMRRLRSDFPNRKELDADIAESFLASELYQNAEQILLYASYNTEANTYRIFSQAREDGKCVFFPRCVPGTNILRFYRVDFLDDLKEDAFGILAPTTSEEYVLTDNVHSVCIVPGLAFSMKGERLGYGRGYYDTYLSQTDICTVGLCYSFQIVENVPTEPHDRYMDYLCTEKGLIPCKIGQHGGKDKI